MKYFTLLLFWISGLSCAQEVQNQFSINFKTDSYKVNKADTKDLLNSINTGSNKVVKEITLIGYCDDRASNDYNLKLASRRVDAVKDLIIEHTNITDSIFNLEPVGELPLYSSIHKSQQRADNRRVEIMVFYKSDAPVIIEKEKSVVDIESYDVFTDSLQVNDNLVFNNVIFYPGTHRLREISYPVMDSIINSLIIHKKYEIEIQGHICCNGLNEPGLDKDTGQWNLSTARAEQIKRFFVKYGLDPTRFTTIGKMANFKTGKSDFYDRRVELHITAIRENETENE
ncbi:OmpA family protein [Nonlabens sp.]|uniref:OmpA family protein n=1 Tax=Nonlabens sp. TaxID=1888209 RepID=UPI0032655A40